MADIRCGVCRREACDWRHPVIPDDPVAALKEQGVNLKDRSSVASAINERKTLLMDNHEKLKAQHPLEMSTEKTSGTELEALIREGHALMRQLVALGVPEKEIEELLHKYGQNYPNWGAE